MDSFFSVPATKRQPVGYLKRKVDVLRGVFESRDERFVAFFQRQAIFQPRSDRVVYFGSSAQLLFRLTLHVFPWFIVVWLLAVFTFCLANVFYTLVSQCLLCFCFYGVTAVSEQQCLPFPERKFLTETAMACSGFEWPFGQPTVSLQSFEGSSKIESKGHNHGCFEFKASPLIDCQSLVSRNDCY